MERPRAVAAAVRPAAKEQDAARGRVQKDRGARAWSRRCALPVRTAVPAAAVQVVIVSIEASVAGPVLVGSIVAAAIEASPSAAAPISSAAVAVAPDALSQIQSAVESSVGSEQAAVVNAGLADSASQNPLNSPPGPPGTGESASGSGGAGNSGAVGGESVIPPFIPPVVNPPVIDPPPVTDP